MLQQAKSSLSTVFKAEAHYVQYVSFVFVYMDYYLQWEQTV